MFSKPSGGTILGWTIGILFLIFAIGPFLTWLGWNVILCWIFPMLPQIVGYWKLFLFPIGMSLIVPTATGSAFKKRG